MKRRSHNTQLFALRQPPPQMLDVAGGRYRLARVFKHDFFAATCLYERVPLKPPGAAPVLPPFEKIVVKFGRKQDFCGLPAAWYGRLLRHHEREMYMRLAGIAGVPRWVGNVGLNGYAIEYVDALPLDHLDCPPAGLFDRLRLILDQIHARGIAYGDANKRSNILVDAHGQPHLIDYQIALRRREDWPWPLRPLMAAAVRYMTHRDLYHLYKHKRRLAPQELTPQEEELSYTRSFLHQLHRKLTDPWRAVRRAFLKRQYQRGALRSPTEGLEDHHQPEKETWRKEE